MAVSEDAHSSITNTLRILEMDPLVVRSEDHRLTGAGLRAAIEADGEPGSLAAIVATSGTTNAGIIDDLAGAAEVARQHQLWFHVDGAYGGAGLFAPSVRDRYAGIEHADSFIVDPHKWLFAPFDCAALLYRNPSVARSVHKQDASYLDVIHDRPGEWNPTDYAYHLTRRARGLPLWFSLSVYGVDAYTEAIETAIGLARQTADEIRGRAHLELVREPSLGVVLFRRAAGTRGSTPRGPTGCCRIRWPSYRRRRGRARRWRGSRSCTRTPRWTWCARSSTGWTDGFSSGGGVLPGTPPGDAGGLAADWLRVRRRDPAGQGRAPARPR